jgi:hypothetical protein
MILSGCDFVAGVDRYFLKVLEGQQCLDDGYLELAFIDVPPSSLFAYTQYSSKA